MATPGTQPVSGPGPLAQRQDQAPGQPIRVPTGMPYGSAKELEQAQSAVPLPQGPPGQPGQPAGPQDQGPVPTQQPMPGPGDLMGMLAHPTQRPNEPVTATLPGGVGAENDTLGSLLNRVAATGNSDAAYLAAAVNGGRR